MSSINLAVEIAIDAAPTDVAAVMFDPQREPEWVGAVKAVEVVDPALQPGARVRRSGEFMGQAVTWATTVETVHFPHALTLRVTDAPFTGTLSYQIQRGAAGSVARIQARGETTLMAFLPSSLIEGPLRSVLGEDLARLKKIVERK